MFDRDKYDYFGFRKQERYTKEVSFETGRESRRRIRKENRKRTKF